MYIYIYTHVFNVLFVMGRGEACPIHIYIYIYIYVYVYVCMYVCMYVYIYIYIHMSLYVVSSFFLSFWGRGEARRAL